MPRDKDFKRRVRTRMKKTGEAYTTARTHLLDRSEADGPEPVTDAPAPDAAAPGAPPDYAAVAGKSDATIEAKTGRTWQQWIDELDRHDAVRMPHGDIARLVSGQYGVDGWWAQTVTVGYERIKGLRERGQRRDGSFEASKSRTFPVPVTTLFDACADEAVRRRWLTGADPRVTTATRPRSIRLRWDDGTIVVLGFTDRAATKSVLTAQHTGLPDRAAAERIKAYWSERLAALADLLSAS